MFTHLFIMSVIVIVVLIAVGQGIFTIATKSSKK
jgi:hypothetical protein